MRFLKLKIARAALYRNDSHSVLTYGQPSKLQPAKASPPPKQQKSPVLKVQEPKVSSPASVSSDKKQYKRSKGNNIMKNYCQAMISFSLSPLSDFYIAREPESKELSLERFRQILSAQKTKINCIKSLREALLIEEKDCNEVQLFKRLFQVTCKIFIKYFSVNWIYNGKLTDRVRYLEYRGKILRRIKHPEHFTFLKSFVEKKPKSNRNKRL